jgi:hypothetical protein
MDRVLRKPFHQNALFLPSISPHIMFATTHSLLQCTEKTSMPLSQHGLHRRQGPCSSGSALVALVFVMQWRATVPRHARGGRDPSVSSPRRMVLFYVLYFRFRRQLSVLCFFVLILCVYIQVRTKYKIQSTTNRDAYIRRHTRRDREAPEAGEQKLQRMAAAFAAETTPRGQSTTSHQIDRSGGTRRQQLHGSGQLSVLFDLDSLQQLSMFHEFQLPVTNLPNCSPGFQAQFVLHRVTYSIAFLPPGAKLDYW